MEAIDVLGGADRGDHRLFVEVAGQWQLDEDTVHRRIGVQLRDQCEQVRLGRIGGQAVLEAFHVCGYGRLVLAAHIDLARRILAHEYHREARLAARRLGEFRRLLADALAQPGGECLPVDDLRRHQP